MSRDITPGQARVLPLVHAGFTNRQIAAHLGIAEKTVKNHLTAIYDRTWPVNRNELRKACEEGTVHRDYGG